MLDLTLRRSAFSALAVLVVSAGALGAQAPVTFATADRGTGGSSLPVIEDARPATAAAAPLALGPTMDVGRAGVRSATERAPVARQTAAMTNAAVRAARPRAGQDVALMAVGGAAFVLGAVVGGDAGTLLMVGGVVTGLIGLYQYLR